METKALRVTLNQSKRTATIRIHSSTGKIEKYKTHPFSIIQWEEVEEWSNDDWDDWMDRTENYWKIK